VRNPISMSMSIYKDLVEMIQWSIEQEDGVGVVIYIAMFSYMVLVYPLILVICIVFWILSPIGDLIIKISKEKK